MEKYLIQKEEIAVEQVQILNVFTDFLELKISNTCSSYFTNYIIFSIHKMRHYLLCCIGPFKSFLLLQYH